VSEGVREFLRGPGGKGVAIGVLVLGLATVCWSIWSNVRTDPTVVDANTPLFIDSETGQTFHVTLKVGMEIPVKSPFTGRATGYKAELCYWTKDGQPKTEPTAVLMNEDIGKPGPTFCPDCGRLVVEHNPMPGPGVRPPPTKAEWLSTHHSSNNDQNRNPDRN
jgi:hypothetical protein